jgi:hypothetical protein
MFFICFVMYLTYLYNFPFNDIIYIAISNIFVERGDSMMLENNNDKELLIAKYTFYTTLLNLLIVIIEYISH